jgi:hypothetical protein
MTKIVGQNLKLETMITCRRVSNYICFTLLMKKERKVIYGQGEKKDEESTFIAEDKLLVESSWIGTIRYIVPWNPTI